MGTTRLVQFDVGTNRHYVRFEGRNYQCPLVSEASAFKDGDRVTIDTNDDRGVTVRRADGWRETWKEPSVSYIEGGNYGAADWSGE